MSRLRIAGMALVVTHRGARRFLPAGLALVTTAAALGPAAAQRADTTREPTPYEQLQLFSNVLNQIRANYIDSVTYEALVRAAIDGMLHALDPHSQFMPRAEWERLDAFEHGDLPGVGLELEQEDSLVTVLGVTPGGPAAKAGIQPGDRITTVNDTVVAGLRATEVALRLTGPKGSSVALLVERGSRLDPQRMSVVLKRRSVKPPPTTISGMADSITGYVWLAWFGPKAPVEVPSAVRGLRRRGARQLILDLRDNPGGIAQAALDIAALFLPKGTLVFRTKGRKADANKDYVSPRDGDLLKMPLIVLINEHSASASEALTGSLQDHDRALIVGRRSFGKALVQTGFLLMPAGDMVMLTIAHVLTPSGRFIQRRYQGVGYRQYVSLAGKAGAVEDTVAVYHTDRGREVRGGGGIVPDVSIPAPTELPIWWSVAVDSGFDVAVADSIATTLSTTQASRAQWTNTPSRWATDLLAPFLARVRARLHVSAQPDSALAARVALRLAVRAATVRWPPDGGDEVGIRNDPEIRTAVSLFPRLPNLLGARAP